MDYFLPKAKTYMPPIPDEFPVDPNNWRACIRGTGDENQSWTCAREIGKAVVELLAAPEWVCGKGSDLLSEQSILRGVSQRVYTITGVGYIRRWRMEHVQRSGEGHGEISQLGNRLFFEASCPDNQYLQIARSRYPTSRRKTLCVSSRNTQTTRMWPSLS